MIFAGTTSRQRTYVAPLSEIAGNVQADAPDDSALVVVGDVVRLRAALQWFAEPEHTRP